MHNYVVEPSCSNTTGIFQKIWLILSPKLHLRKHMQQMQVKRKSNPIAELIQSQGIQGLHQNFNLRLYITNTPTPHMLLKLIYSEKATKFCEIFTVDLTGTTQDKSTVEISQNFVAFSEYMNFTSPDDLAPLIMTSLNQIRNYFAYKKNEGLLIDLYMY